MPLYAADEMSEDFGAPHFTAEGMMGLSPEAPVFTARGGIHSVSFNLEDKYDPFLLVDCYPDQSVTRSSLTWHSRVTVSPN